MKDRDNNDRISQALGAMLPATAVFMSTKARYSGRLRKNWAGARRTAQREEKTVFMGRHRKIWLGGLPVVAVMLLVVASFVAAHAILKEASPAANSKVAGPDVPIMLKYNVRVDANLSKLSLLNPDNSTTDLKIEEPRSPDTLTSMATGLKPGAYRIRWQVLAPDGHITRGEIPFTVTGS